MGSTPRASPQDVAAVAGGDNLPGKGAPAALLEYRRGVIWAMLVRSHEQTAAASFDVKKAGGRCCEAPFGFHVKAKGQ